MKPLKTKKLLITPMTDEELGEKIAREKEAHMSAALREMLDGCRQHPQDRDWYTGWRITLQTTGEEMGRLKRARWKSDMASNKHIKDKAWGQRLFGRLLNGPFLRLMYIL